jgi:hypothetical protein
MENIIKVDIKEIGRVCGVDVGGFSKRTNYGIVQTR